jgi:fused signal recognition particle receptor
MVAFGFFSKLKEGLEKTRRGFVAQVETLLSGHPALDEDFYEELEALLVQADVGVATATKILEQLKTKVRGERDVEPERVRVALKEVIREILGDQPRELAINGRKPSVVLVVGVNGVGKTTTIGKLAARISSEGHRVMLAAGDTFRAAAAEQLSIWGERTGSEVVKHQSGADPAAVAFDAVKAAQARGADVVIVDTAGRLHTKDNLMEEVKKIRRVIEREISGAPHEVLLVLDATTGQNAASQAKLFGEAVGVTGVVLTKLDGTAKGGVVIAIADVLGTPVKFVGVGEKAEDLRPFDPAEFVEALFVQE